MYATDAHLSGWRHRKRAKHADWYLDSLAISDYKKPWFLRSGNTWRCLECKREANWGHMDSEQHKMRVSCFVLRDNKWWCQRCGCEADRDHLESKRHEKSGDAKHVWDKAPVSVSESKGKTLAEEMLETNVRRVFSEPDAGRREDDLSRQRIEESSQNMKPRETTRGLERSRDVKENPGEPRSCRRRGSSMVKARPR